MLQGPTAAKLGGFEVKSLCLRPDLLGGWQVPNYLSSDHCFSRKLGLAVELGLKPRPSDVGYRHPKPQVDVQRGDSSHGSLPK